MRALGACSVWSGLGLGLVLTRLPPADLFGILVFVGAATALLASWGTWLFTRRRATPLPLLVLIALPVWVVAFVIVDNVVANGR